MEMKDVLSQLRRQAGLTQKQVADFIGYSSNGYASWEQGYANPPNEIRAILAELYEIDETILLHPERYDRLHSESKPNNGLFLIHVTKEELAFILKLRNGKT